jgi:predicted phosphohydrolase
MNFHLRVLSDIHLEFENYSIKALKDINQCSHNDQKPTILVLSGDISPDHHKSKKMIQEYLKLCPNDIVIFILGNHDYYDKTINETIKIWKEIEIDLYHTYNKSVYGFSQKRFYFLHNEPVELYNYIFWGSTFWTNLNELDNDVINLCNTFIMDYRAIKTENNKSITCHDTYNLHQEAKQSLLKIIEQSKKRDKKLIVITHHLPTFYSSHPRFGGKASKLNYSFASDNLDEIIKESVITHWIHGHTHDSYDYNYLGTRIVCNPKGVKNENKQFNHEFTLTPV